MFVLYFSLLWRNLEWDSYTSMLTVGKSTDPVLHLDRYLWPVRLLISPDCEQNKRNLAAEGPFLFLNRLKWLQWEFHVLNTPVLGSHVHDMELLFQKLYYTKKKRLCDLPHTMLHCVGESDLLCPVHLHQLHAVTGIQQLPGCCIQLEYSKNKYFKWIIMRHLKNNYYKSCYEISFQLLRTMNIWVFLNWGVPQN